MNLSSNQNEMNLSQQSQRASANNFSRKKVTNLFRVSFICETSFHCNWHLYRLGGLFRVKHFLTRQDLCFYIKELFHSLFDSCDVGVFGSWKSWIFNLSFVVELNSAENFECNPMQRCRAFNKLNWNVKRLQKSVHFSDGIKKSPFDFQ